MKKIFLLFLVLPFVSCDQNVSQSKQNNANTRPVLDSFYGNWLIAEYFIPLDSPGYSGTLSSSHLGLTEIVFSVKFKDSLMFVNEDLEQSMEKIEMVSNDTILLSLTDAPYNRIAYNRTTRQLQYQIDERYPVYHFFKAPDSLVDPVSGTAFKKKINSYLTQTNYHETGDNRYPESRSRIVFTEDGNVKGIEDFTGYSITVNGDLNNIQDASRIDFSNEKRKESYGLIMTSKGFDLYTIQLITLPDEKPVYKMAKLFKSFTRNE